MRNTNLDADPGNLQKETIRNAKSDENVGLK
jgi:hypothetical protein